MVSKSTIGELTRLTKFGSDQNKESPHQWIQLGQVPVVALALQSLPMDVILDQSSKAQRRRYRVQRGYQRRLGLGCFTKLVLSDRSDLSERDTVKIILRDDGLPWLVPSAWSATISGIYQPGLSTFVYDGV